MNEQAPLVSVICLCYNHAPYVTEALASVWAQTYDRVELIVVDDASTDNSVAIIKDALGSHPTVPFIALTANKGNCYAFNRGLALAKGKWVVDLSADDVLMPERLEKQISLAQTLSDDYGVLFSDAWLMDSHGTNLRRYYPHDSRGKITTAIPHGNIYEHLLRKAFICTPTMLMRKKMLLALGGYNEALSYEDYDLWVRSGRDWKYAFQDEPLTKKRMIPHSHRSGFYKKRANVHLRSTLQICQTAFGLVRNKEEQEALAFSVRYHLRQSLWMECFDLVFTFESLRKQLTNTTMIDRVWYGLAYFKIPLYWLYQWYLKLKANKKA